MWLLGKELTKLPRDEAEAFIAGHELGREDLFDYAYETGDLPRAAECGDPQDGRYAEVLFLLGRYEECSRLLHTFSSYAALLLYNSREDILKVDSCYSEQKRIFYADYFTSNRRITPSDFPGEAVKMRRQFLDKIKDKTTLDVLEALNQKLIALNGI